MSRTTRPDIELTPFLSTDPQTRFRVHFPHLYEALEANPETNWSDEFTRAEENEYRRLTPADKELFRAAKRGDLAVIEAQLTGSLSKLVSVESLKDSGGRNIFFWARTNLHNHLLNYFFQVARKYLSDPWYNQEFFGLNPFNNRPLIHFAILFRQSPEVLRELIHEDPSNLMVKDHHPDFGYTPLHVATLYGNPEAVETLISLGAPIDVKDVSGYAPIHYACKKGFSVATNILLTHGASTESCSFPFNFTPLHIAATAGKINIIEILLDKGALIDSYGSDAQSTPLQGAIFANQIAAVRYLLERGADAHRKDLTRKSSCLHYAARTNNPEFIRLLVERGVEVTTKDKYGYSALAVAAHCNNIETTKALFQYYRLLDPATLLAELNAVFKIEVIPYSPADDTNRSRESALMYLADELKTLKARLARPSEATRSAIVTRPSGIARYCCCLWKTRTASARIADEAATVVLNPLNQSAASTSLPEARP